MSDIPKYAYLDDEETLIVNKVLACAIGLNASIAYRQLHFWIKVYRKANSQKHCRDGAWWVYNTYDQWRSNENFPFWSISTIRRQFKLLEDLGLVVSTSEYNEKKYDDTKWYAIDYEVHKLFLAMWHDFGAPNATGKEYNEFLDQWNRSKPQNPLFKLVPPAVQVGTPPVQIEQTNTRDYTESNNKEKQKEKETTSSGGDFSSDMSEITTLYMNNIGVIAPLVVDELKAYVQEVGKEWVADAIRIAVRANKRSMRYISGVIEKWRLDGKTDITPQASQPITPHVEDKQPESYEPLTPEMIAEFDRAFAELVEAKRGK